jgi:hypothetical protein
MSARRQPYEHYGTDPIPVIAMIAVAVGVFVSAPALALGIALAPLARRARGLFAGLAGLGVLAVALLWGRTGGEMQGAARAGARAGMLVHVDDAAAAA